MPVIAACLAVALASAFTAAATWLEMRDLKEDLRVLREALSQEDRTPGISP